MSKRIKITMEVHGSMDDEGNIVIPRQAFKADLDDVEYVDRWADDDDVYLLHLSDDDRLASITCGDAREIIGSREHACT